MSSSLSSQVALPLHTSRWRHIAGTDSHARPADDAVKVGKKKGWFKGGEIKVTLSESHRAWASYQGPG